VVNIVELEVAQLMTSDKARTGCLRHPNASEPTTRQPDLFSPCAWQVWQL